MSALLRAKFVLSNKQKNILVDETVFQYRLKTKIKDVEYWECRLKDAKMCRATAITICVEKDIFIKTLKVYK